MAPLEIEVKFYVADSAGLRRQIIATGAAGRGRIFETNVRFDDDRQSLFKAQSLLRLRQDERATLTYKSRPTERDDQFKIHRELEVQISDFSVMEQIIESIGFQRQQIYEKWRETFILDNTHLCLDSMPFGDFLELEGSKDDIIRTAAHLGLAWHQRILCNYLELFDIIKEKLRLPFTDITFENFKDVSININEFIDIFRNR